jgi:hypothetical protein
MHALQILALLQRLANVLGTQVATLLPVVMPVLNYALNVEGEEAITLLEDAIILWVVMLRNSPSNIRNLLSLWPHWKPIATLHLEYVPYCMLVALSAILLGGMSFVQVCSDSSSILSLVSIGFALCHSCVSCHR